MRAERKEERLTGAAEEEEKNVMPSMVVRQQRLYHVGATEAARFEQPQLATQEAAPHHLPGASSATTLKLMRPTKAAHLSAGEPARQPASKTFDRDGLVLPKRLTHNLGSGPGCALSGGQPIIRDLNRELKFNQVRGKNVLEQKSELKRALEKLEDNRRKKELEQQRLSRRTSLELRLEERAERLAKESQHEEEEEELNQRASLALGRRRKNETAREQKANAETSASAASTCDTAAANAGRKTALVNFTIKSMTR